jgi:hypothetical protein
VGPSHRERPWSGLGVLGVALAEMPPVKKGFQRCAPFFLSALWWRLPSPAVPVHQSRSPAQPPRSQPSLVRASRATAAAEITTTTPTTRRRRRRREHLQQRAPAQDTDLCPERGPRAHRPVSTIDGGYFSPLVAIWCETTAATWLQDGAAANRHRLSRLHPAGHQVRCEPSCNKRGRTPTLRSEPRSRRVLA